MIGFLLIPGSVLAAAPPEAPPPEVAPEPTPPRLLEAALPSYPTAARDRGLSGEVVVRLRVLEDGTVADPRVVASTDPVFEAAALEAARRLRFAPARVGDRPVATWIDYRFRFELALADEHAEAAPASLYGVAVDLDGHPLPGARVRLIPLDDPAAEPRELLADEAGRFHAPFLGSGRWRVEVSTDTLPPVGTEVTLKAGETLEGRFTAGAPEGREEMVVRLGRQTWREVTRGELAADPGTVTGSYTLTRRDIEATPGALEDAARAAQALPGVAGDPDLLATFSVRGGDPDEVVFLLDRVPLDNPFHLAGFNSVFNPDMIRSIRFHASAPPADVPAATSGVMAVTSWDGTLAQEGDRVDGALDLSASSARALLMGPLGASDDLTFAVAARRSYIEGYFEVLKALGMVDEAFAAPEFWEVSARAAWRPTEDQRLVLTGLTAGDSLGVVPGGEDDLIRFDGTFQLENTLRLVALDHLASLRPDLEAQTTLAWVEDTGHVLQDLGTQVERDTRSARWFGRSDLRWTPGEHAVEGGVEVSRIAIGGSGEIEDPTALPTWATTPIADFEAPMVEVSDLAPFPEASGYLQGTWNGPLRVRLGSRATWAGSTEEWLLSPSAGISLPLPTGTIPKLAAALQHRPIRDPLLLSPETGNPDLGAERALHAVAGLDQALPLPGEAAGGLLRLEAWVIELDRLVVHPDDQPGYSNAGTGRSWGVDLLLAARGGRLSGTATLSYMEATRTNPLNERFPETVPAPWDQRLAGSASVEWQATPRWRLTTRFAGHTGRPTSSVAPGVGDQVVLAGLNDRRLGPTASLDLRAEWRRAWRLGRLSAYLEVLNVLDFRSDFVELVVVEDGQLQTTMLTHLPIRPYLGLRWDF